MKSLIRQSKSSPRAASGKLYKQLIEDFSPLVHFVAKSIAKKLPRDVDVNDLISEGLIGLIDAIHKFDIDRSVSFRTYAEYRIRGAILDSLRSQDWIPRSVRDEKKRLERAIVDLELALGRTPECGEIAVTLGLSIDALHDMRAKVSLMRPVPEGDIREIAAEKLDHNPEESLFRKIDLDNLNKLFEQLSDDRRRVLSLYYYEQLTMKEIGKLLGVSESRISQIHGGALQQLRRIFGPQDEGSN